VLFTYTVVAQEFGSLRTSYELKIPQKIQKLVLDPLPAGTYFIGSGGDFPTIDSAFNKLSIDGIAGNVTLELIDELYTATTSQYGFLLNGPIPGAGPNSRVTIKPAENKNVIVEGNGEGIFHFNNTSYLILDGVGISGPTTLTVHNLVTTPVSYNDAIDFIGNCDHNVVQNTIALTEDITRVNCGVIFWPEDNVIGTSDSNLVQNNFIMKATYGIYLGANQFQGSKASGNIIRGNIIGSETDSLISCAGIQTERVENTIIENNLIRNIKRQVLTFWEPDTYGINTWEGIETVIRNNVIHNLGSNVDWGIIGILVSASSPGVNNMIYNNMIFNINSTSIHSDSRVAGIQIYNQVNPKIYYNSVYLTGNGNGANPIGSTALLLRSGITNADVKNNIFVNTRDESPYCASAIYDYSAANLTSDYNDLYYDDANQNNCLVRISSTNYFTLSDWQATGKDLHSYVEMPHFKAPYLHITENEETLLESRGIPIAGIEKDFDGQTRHSTTPDIGADEFNGIMVGIEDEKTLPTEFALAQNFPNPFNPSTKISWQTPVGSWQTLKVYDVLGNEIATLVDEYKPAGRYEIELNSHSGLSGIKDLPSGVYFYQLKAGEFINTKKMILLK
jgi:hypothetical protein